MSDQPRPPSADESVGGGGFHPVPLDALGPFLNVFLVTERHWSQSQVGLVTMVGGLLGLAVQTPIGGWIDQTRAKRAAIVLALAVLSVGAVVT